MSEFTSFLAGIACEGELQVEARGKGDDETQNKGLWRGSEGRAENAYTREDVCRLNITTRSKVLIHRYFVHSFISEVTMRLHA